ncbi:DMT family transporter, partial [Burkholderia contaminans]|uniref:DMT family transporter n=1 Tax=Burkholderia contaminans TaxID=488447 RepID=UPI002D7F8F19
MFPFCAIALWAGNVVVSKLSASTIDPSAITFYRLLLAVALMSVFTLRPAWRNRAALAAHLPKLAVLGFLAMALFQSLSYEAAKTTSATNMAIITALVPLMTMLLSSLLLGDPPGAGMVGGGVLSLAGVVYLIADGHPMTIAARGVHTGDLLMLAASAAYALYGVLLKRWRIGALPAWQSTYVQALAALVFMVPM